MRSARTFELASCLILLAGCAHATLRPTSPESRFERAMRDAERADADEIRTDLVVLATRTPGLVTRESESGPDVLVATWTDGRYYPEAHGTPKTLGHDHVWVTTAPEIRVACSAAARGEQTPRERLREFLGLRPETDHPHIVEFWVPISAMVRPCPDPAVTDSSCRLGEPDTRPLGPTADYAQWFEELEARSYLPNGYPWTRLGYTYDWGEGRDERGASEFLVPVGVTVTIEAVTPVDDYCGP